MLYDLAVSTGITLIICENEKRKKGEKKHEDKIIDRVSWREKERGRACLIVIINNLLLKKNCIKVKLKWSV